MAAGCLLPGSMQDLAVEQFGASTNALLIVPSEYS